MSEGNKTDREIGWTSDAGEYITEEHVLALSEQPSEKNNEPPGELRRLEKERSEQDDLSRATDELTGVVGTAGAPECLIGEEDETIALACFVEEVGVSAWERFDAEGRVEDIDTAVENLRRAVELTPNSHPDKPGRLSNLGSSHLARFDRLGEVADIEKAIESQLSAVELTPKGHPDRPGVLTNLGNSHLARFECLGEIIDIGKAIESQLSAVEATPNGHPDKPGRLSNLGNSHMRQFERFGQMGDIEKAVESHLSAIELTPNGHHDKPGLLNNLGKSYITRFECLGEVADINKAIESQLSAVQLSPNGNPNKQGRLNNPGSSHLARFKRFGEMVDIDKAIESQLSAVQLTPNGHPDKPMYLADLGKSRMVRFERLGEIGDIDNAIESQLSAVHLTPNTHSSKPGFLNNLGASYLTRFERLGEMADIDKSIKTQLSAVELTPKGHSGKPRRLNNLGNSHLARFERLSEMADIDKAIESQLSAVELTPGDHQDKPAFLNNLGNSYLARFERLSEMADINKAIESQLSAVNLTPNGHPNKPMYLNNLGVSHARRFKSLGTIADIDMATKSQLSAVELTPNGHPDKPKYLNNLGGSHLRRFRRLGEMEDIDIAVANFEQCATSIVGPPIVRFKAAHAWISGLQLKKIVFGFRTSSLRPQQTLINLIPELVWLGAPIYQRFQMVQDVVGSSIHEAVSDAIRAQELQLAVEWMEQGRSIVWNQLRQLRSPLVDLQDSHPFLAQDFQDAQRRIELCFLRSDLLADTAADSLEQQAQAHRSDIQRREELLAEIRSKKGFESFLRPEKFPVLSKACHGRLVVLLTVSKDNCDALVISPSSLITHLSFTNMSQGDISDLHIQWECSRGTRLSNRGEVPPALLSVDRHAHPPPMTRPINRGEGPSPLDMEPMTSLLSDLWEKIVHPIVKETEASLWESTGDRLPRITWCPSGLLSFLPFHAAGIYGSNPEDRISISDFAVSSYTPSLMALRSNPAPLGHPTMLIVTQPNTPNQNPLPGTLHEAEKIMKKANMNKIQPYVHHLSHSQASVSAVTEQLKSHGWVHLACHGTQKFPDPMESYFALHDGHLSLASLMQNSIGHAQFAFLSACQTATGEQTLPDEAMHLTSGMLAAGFPSVVGTMWSIEDRVAPDVAEAFYTALFEEGRQSAWTTKPEPAYALHSALRSYRERSTGDRDLMQWVPFVHYGI
ncbi:CHAT domain-containing protein [Flagelloscypha sp. PMI_526]|nr:CHAT domain-containing protein [Flagelloscypha sp. PMI_526]